MLTTVVRHLRDRARRGGGEAGITLAELLVTMGLMSMIGALALTLFLGTTQTADATTDSSIATAGARTAVSSWSGLLQVAVAPVPGTPAARGLTLTTSSLTFNAQLGNRNLCSDAVACTSGTSTPVTLSLTAGALTQTIGTTSATLVPAGVQPGAGCVFTAYRANGTSLGCDPTKFTGNRYNAVARIDIAFSITQAGTKARNFTTSVSLPRP